MMFRITGRECAAVLLYIIVRLLLTTCKYSYLVYSESVNSIVDSCLLRWIKTYGNTSSGRCIIGTWSFFVTLVSNVEAFCCDNAVSPFYKRAFSKHCKKYSNSLTLPWFHLRLECPCQGYEEGPSASLCSY